MKLIEGVEKFKSSVFPEMQGCFEELAGGQSPETLFITCSDSRINPHMLTQSKPGELFIIRNAGNIVAKPGNGELGSDATIQYAVDVLKVKNIVVCGHSKCGAVTGLMNQDSLSKLPVICEWVKVSDAVVERVADVEGDKVPEAIAENVMLQLEHLREHECVRNAISEGRLTLHGWVYHFERGEIDFLTAT